MSTKLQVNEIFGPTLQGEGPSTGEPAVFLRLATCNLNCWWCDTPYTWAYSANKARLHVSGNAHLARVEVHAMEIEEVREHLLELRGDRQLHLVITGGEPMLQQRALVALLCDEEFAEKFYVEVETAGTIGVLPEMWSYVDQWNVSPKLPSSGNEFSKRFRPEVLQELQLRNTAFKFVVSDDADLHDVELIVDTLQIPPTRVWLMAEGATRQEQLVNARPVAEEAIFRGWRFSPRLHTLLWDNARGV